MFHTYMEGYLGGIRMTQAVLKFEVMNLPDSPTHEQYARVIYAYLTKYPEQLHQTARVLMYLALNDAFPKNTQKK